MKKQDVVHRIGWYRPRRGARCALGPALPPRAAPGWTRRLRALSVHPLPRCARCADRGRASSGRWSPGSARHLCRRPGAGPCEGARPGRRHAPHRRGRRRRRDIAVDEAVATQLNATPPRGGALLNESSPPCCARPVPGSAPPCWPHHLHRAWGDRSSRTFMGEEPAAAEAVRIAAARLAEGRRRHRAGRRAYARSAGTSNSSRRRQCAVARRLPPGVAA